MSWGVEIRAGDVPVRQPDSARHQTILLSAYNSISEQVMNTNTEAQNNQAGQKLSIDFSHRLLLQENEAINARTLSDIVGNMVSRATGSLEMMSGQFVDECERGPRMSDDGMFYVIESAIKELEDIRAVVNYFYKIDNRK